MWAPRHNRSGLYLRRCPVPHRGSLYWWFASVFLLLPALDAWQGVLIQQGYNPFVAKPVWLCGLMSGEENVFPRQYIGKPLCLVHTSWFTSLSSCRGQKRGIAVLSWGCSGKQPGQ